MRTAPHPRVFRSFCAGVYDVVTDGLVFKVIKREDGHWYWVNARDPGEVGGDLFPTKKEAVAAVVEYLVHRKQGPEYGSCHTL